MEQDGELIEWKGKVHQRIGRNVLLFQQMEQLLKILLPRATVTVSSQPDARSMMSELGCAVETWTLGNLVDRFIKEVCVPNELNPKDDSDGLQVTATFRLRFESSEGRDAQIKRLKALVEGRNRLVHHFLPQIEADSIESWRSIHDELEVQQQQVLSEIETLRHLVETIAMSGALVAHPEIQRELVCGPIREQLIEKLRFEAGKSADPDGWTSLKAVLRSGGGVFSDAITDLLVHYELPNLSAFLEIVGGFEIRHESDQKGRTRTFYRVTTPEHSPTPDSSTQET
jgi:hypothetical protein